MKEIEITVGTEEIEGYLYGKLIKKGYVPTDKEIEILSNIFFDYLVEKKIIEEEK